MSNILCVGGSGFVGSHVADYIGDFTNVDLKDGKDFCDPVTNGVCRDVNVIIMLAANMEYDKAGYLYNLKLYEAMAKFNQAHIIFVSSAAVYGDSTVKHREKEVLQPATLYGKSKRLGEQIVQDLFDNYTIVRLSNVYGDGDGHGVIDLFKKGNRIIYGNGQQVRDYVSADRVARAIASIVKYPEKHNKEIYNISSGVGITVNEAFKKYGEGTPVYSDERSFDVAYSVLDNSIAKLEGLV